MNAHTLTFINGPSQGQTINVSDATYTEIKAKGLPVTGPNFTIVIYRLIKGDKLACNE